MADEPEALTDHPILSETTEAAMPVARPRLAAPTTARELRQQRFAHRHALAAKKAAASGPAVLMQVPAETMRLPPGTHDGTAIIVPGPRAGDPRAGRR